MRSLIRLLAILPAAACIMAVASAASAATSTLPARGTAGFHGEWHNPDGTIYLRGRIYHPGVKRFLQRDPWHGSVMAPQSLNRYAYVENNPATWADPSGFSPKKCGFPFHLFQRCGDRAPRYDDPLQNLTDLAAGFGSGVTFGLTDAINRALGNDGAVQHGSGFYRYGQGAGLLAGVAAGRAGRASPRAGGSASEAAEAGAARAEAESSALPRESQWPVNEYEPGTGPHASAKGPYCSISGNCAGISRSKVDGTLDLRRPYDGPLANQTEGLERVPLNRYRGGEPVNPSDILQDALPNVGDQGMVSTTHFEGVPGNSHTVVARRTPSGVELVDYQRGGRVYSGGSVDRAIGVGRHGGGSGGLYRPSAL